MVLEGFSLQSWSRIGDICIWARYPSGRTGYTLGIANMDPNWENKDPN